MILRFGAWEAEPIFGRWGFSQVKNVDEGIAYEEGGDEVTLGYVELYALLRHPNRSGQKTVGMDGAGEMRRKLWSEAPIWEASQKRVKACMVWMRSPWKSVLKEIAEGRRRSPGL